MDAILEIANRHSLLVIEDAAQGIMSTYRGRPLGSIGHLAALSFHETKNIISGEGGALLINDARFVERAEVVREKGTNRSQFFRGMVDKYTWTDFGSSYLPSELISAFLWAQMEEADNITRRRIDLWNTYNRSLGQMELAGKIRRPVVPQGCSHNAHMYYLLMPSLSHRADFMSRLKAQGVNTVFHYVPLHSSPFGEQHSRSSGVMANTCDVSDRLVRLPMWLGLEDHQAEVIQIIVGALQ
jgi:dTDP-4-amino-4,6-dideoxygalactose transaminase